MLLFITIGLAKEVLGKILTVPFNRNIPLRENMHGSKKKKKLDSFKLLALVAYFFDLCGLYRIYIWTRQFLIIMVGVLTVHDNKRQSNKQSS